MTRFGQRSLHRPSEPQSRMECSYFQPYALSPTCQDQCLAVPGDHAITGVIFRLLLFGGPSAIAKTVPYLVIYSLDRQLGRRFGAHIEEKILERSSPPLADGYPFRTVLALWGKTAAKHGSPRLIFRGLSIPTSVAVRPGSAREIPHPLTAVAAAGRGVPLTEPRRGHVDRRPAYANARPDGIAVLDRMSSRHREPPEKLPGQVYEVPWSARRRRFSHDRGPFAVVVSDRPASNRLSVAPFIAQFSRPTNGLPHFTGGKS